jgi:hypothetical protein
VTTEHVPVTDNETRYLSGKNKATLNRLQEFSGTTMRINEGYLYIKGNKKQRDLALVAVDITKHQMNNSGNDFDYDQFEREHDGFSCVDVPIGKIGFVMGTKFCTLRSMEQKFNTFMFLNNGKTYSDDDGYETKRLYIIGDTDSREEVEREIAKLISISGKIRNPTSFDNSAEPRDDLRDDRRDSRDDRRDSRDDRRDSRDERRNSRDDRQRDHHEQPDYHMGRYEYLSSPYTSEARKPNEYYSNYIRELICPCCKTRLSIPIPPDRHSHGHPY